MNESKYVLTKHPAHHLRKNCLSNSVFTLILITGHVCASGNLKQQHSLHVSNVLPHGFQSDVQLLE
jgi:hypothetical protein